MAGRKEKKRVWRKNTTDVHPLFEGDVALFWKDSEWRKDIRRAGAQFSRRPGSMLGPEVR